MLTTTGFDSGTLYYSCCEPILPGTLMHSSTPRRSYKTRPEASNGDRGNVQSYRILANLLAIGQHEVITVLL